MSILNLLHVYPVRDAADRGKLKGFFSQGGLKVAGVDIIGKGCALVGYCDKNDAQRAIKSLNHAAFDGRVLDIKWSTLFTEENIAAVREKNYGFCLREFICFNWNVYDCDNAVTGGQCLRGKHFCFFCLLNGLGHLPHKNRDSTCPSRQQGWKDLPQFKSSQQRLPQQNGPARPAGGQAVVLHAPQVVRQQSQVSASKNVQPKPVQASSSSRHSQPTLAGDGERSMGQSSHGDLRESIEGQVSSLQSELGQLGDDRRRLNRENLKKVIAYKRHQPISSDDDTVGSASKAPKFGEPSTSKPYPVHLAHHTYQQLSSKEKQQKNFLCAPMRNQLEGGAERESVGGAEHGLPQEMSSSFPVRYSKGPVERKQLRIDTDVADELLISLREIENASKTTITLSTKTIYPNEMLVVVVGINKDIAVAKDLLQQAVLSIINRKNGKN